MPPPWRIETAELAVTEQQLGAIARFYLDLLGLAGERLGDHLRLSVGGSELRFDAAPNDREPFYHFALLVPGDRFEAARNWLSARVPLLAQPGSDQTTFSFEFWDARACYAHDPVGNIVELIAHRGLVESREEGEFSPADLIGISELGVVTGDLLTASDSLRRVGLELWFGDISGEREGLGFVGRQAHTLILCPPGRPWLPTGRPAEAHPVAVTIGAGEGPRILVRVDRDSHDVLRTECVPRNQTEGR